MSLGCHNHYGISNYPVCSGHGVCIAGKCVCDSGWTSITDFELVQGEDCDMNIASIKALSIMNVAMACISLLIVSVCIYRDDMLSVKKRFKIKTLCSISFWFVNISALLYVSGKIIAPSEYVVGKSIISTIGGVMIIASTMYGTSAFFIILLKFLRSYAKLLDSQTKTRIMHITEIFTKLAPIVPTVFTLLLIATMIGVFCLPAEHSDKFNICGGSIMTAAYIYYASTVLYVLYTFLREIHKFIVSSKETSIETAIESGKFAQPSKIDDIEAVYNKVKLASYVFTPFLIGGAPLNIFFVSWYLMRRKLTYLLMLEVTVVTSLSTLLVWSLTSVKASTRQIIPSDLLSSFGRSSKGTGPRSVKVSKRSVVLSRQISVQSKRTVSHQVPQLITM